MKNKVSISSLNQIFAVPLQAESPWQNSQRLILLIIFIHSFLMYKSIFNKHNYLFHSYTYFLLNFAKSIFHTGSMVNSRGYFALSIFLLAFSTLLFATS